MDGLAIAHSALSLCCRALKTEDYCTVNVNPALLYISKTAKKDKGYITNQHVDIYVKMLSVISTVIIFVVIDMCKNA